MRVSTVRAVSTKNSTNARGRSLQAVMARVRKRYGEKTCVNPAVFLKSYRKMKLNGTVGKHQKKRAQKIKANHILMV